MSDLYSKFIGKLIEVNDETKTEEEHRRLLWSFRGWKDGIRDACGTSFNGDYYYIDKIDSGEMEERPMCCGEFLDWKSLLGAE